MKAKVLFSIFALSAMFAGCAKELAFEDGNNVREEVREGYLTISGTMFADTKMTISEGETSAMGLWSEKDTVYVYKKSGEETVSAGVLTLKSGSGKQTATFSGAVSLTSGEEFSLVYKGSGKDVSAGRMAVAKNQTVTAGEAPLNNGVYAFCRHLVYGTSKTFCLTHNEAIVKVMVSTSGNSLDGMKLQSVSLYSPDAWLAGYAQTAPVDGADQTVTLSKEESDTNDDFVKATLSTPVAVGAEATSIWMTAIPADFASSDVYAVAKFVSEDGLTVVNAVKKFTGKALKAGQVNIIKLAGLTAETSDVVWYNPCCSRYVGAEWDLKYAYGTSNTVFGVIDASHKTPVISDIDVRLNSPLDFVDIYKATLKSSSDADYIGIPAKIDVFYVGKASVNGGAFSGNMGGITNTVKDIAITDCKFSIQLVPYNANWYNGSYGTVCLKDASGKRLWGMNLWTAQDEIKEVTLPSGKFVLADKCVGGGNYENAPGGKRVDYAGPYYIQWGRITGVGWGSSMKQGTIKYSNEVTTLKAAVGEYCDYYISSAKDKGAGNTTNNNWFGGSVQHNDLWGNPSETADGNTVNTKTGVKSILDPCPKGWMVACPSALEEVAAGIEDGGLLTKLDGDDYWMKSCGLYLPFSGVKWNGKTDGKNIVQSATCRTNDCGMWSNSSWSTAKSNQAKHYIWQAKSVEDPETLETVPTAVRYGNAEASGVKGKVIGMQVRCMKDTANR